MEELNIEILEMVKYEYAKDLDKNKFPIGFYCIINGELKGGIFFHSQTQWEDTLDELPWEERGAAVMALIERLKEQGHGELVQALQEMLPEYEKMTVFDKYEAILSRMQDMDLEEASELYCQYEAEFEAGQQTRGEGQEPDLLLMELLELLKSRIAELVIEAYKKHRG